LNPATVFKWYLETNLADWVGAAAQYNAQTKGYSFAYAKHDRQISISVTAQQLAQPNNFPTLAASKVQEALA
jgi:hypothetical protein